MSRKRVLIVGGVAGGASCAARLRRLDEQAEIFIFERGPEVSYASCGLPYYVGGVIAQRQHLLVATPERFRDYFRVEVRTRREVRRIDRQAKTIEVHNVETGAVEIEPYDVLVLAPGATPVRPPLPGIDLPGIFALRSVQDADRINAWAAQRRARQAVVVGGGYIGLEMVENLVRRQMHVTLIEKLDQLMPAMDPEMVAPVKEELRRQGVEVRLCCGAKAFERGNDDSILAITEDNQRIRADLVILALGVKPDVHLAEQAGLEIGSTGGIRVDEQMRTSDPHIFAVGDAVEVTDFVTGRPRLVALAGPASRQARVAADVICGRPSRYRGAQGTAVVGVFDLTLAMTGASEKTLRQEGIAYQKSYTHSPHHASYYPGAQQMTIKLLFDPDDGRVLGAQIVGRAGVDKRIDVLAMAIQMGATVYDLEQAELCYAPQYGSARDPVNIAGMAAANIARGDVDVVHWAQLATLKAADKPLPVVLDVREPAEVAAAPVPEAVNIPIGELRTRLHQLPADQEIWTYCAGGQRSYYATRLLRQHGLQACNLSGGYRLRKMLGDGPAGQ
jgi:NADPH-dependent 2,4-dienoyl-CoA reductase/sulfur reductase-like enzyme/rhodanese-related sulfurtransferase